MRKLTGIVSLVLFILTFWISFCCAQEEIRITTYYPSPSGSYNELRSGKLAIGAPATSTMPNTDGVIGFTPLVAAPGSVVEGQMYYDSTVHGLRIMDNSGSWKAVSTAYSVTRRAANACNPGEKMITGGCSCSGGATPYVSSSLPTATGDGWSCACGAGATATTYVLCAN